MRLQFFAARLLQMLDSRMVSQNAVERFNFCGIIMADLLEPFTGGAVCFQPRFRSSAASA